MTKKREHSDLVICGLDTKKLGTITYVRLEKWMKYDDEYLAHHVQQLLPKLNTNVNFHVFFYRIRRHSRQQFIYCDAPKLLRTVAS